MHGQEVGTLKLESHLTVMSGVSRKRMWRNESRCGQTIRHLSHAYSRVNHADLDISELASSRHINNCHLSSIGQLSTPLPSSLRPCVCDVPSRSLRYLPGRLSLPISSFQAFPVDQIVGECMEYMDTLGTKLFASEMLVTNSAHFFPTPKSLHLQI